MGFVSRVIGWLFGALVDHSDHGAIYFRTLAGIRQLLEYSLGFSLSLSLSSILSSFPPFFLSLSFPFHRLPSRRTARGLGGRGVTRFRVAQPYPSDSSRFRPMGRWGNSSDGSDFPDEYPIIIHRSSLLSFPRDSLGILESEVTSGCDTNRFELAFDSICWAERAPFNPLRSLIKTNHF